MNHLKSLPLFSEYPKLCELVEVLQVRVEPLPRHSDMLKDSPHLVTFGCYHWDLDTIYLNPKEAVGPNGAVALLHEVGHWTGGDLRLKRAKRGPRTPEKAMWLAKEELIADNVAKSLLEWFHIPLTDKGFLNSHIARQLDFLMQNVQKRGEMGKLLDNVNRKSDEACLFLFEKIKGVL